MTHRSRAEVLVAARAFEHWADGAWRLESGAFRVHVGTDVARLPLEATVQVALGGS